MKYNFVKELREDGPMPDWMRRNHKTFNIAAKAYNDWQLEGCKLSEKESVLARIEWTITQLKDEYHQYVDMLKEMKQYLESI